MNKIYAGIGSRQTPNDIILIMKQVAILLAHDGHICATGACKGADQAFAEGALLAGGRVKLYVPWKSYEQSWIQSLQSNLVECFILQDIDREAHDSVSLFHPAYEKLSPSVKALHARNYNILKHALFIVCWTNDGQFIGGTGQALRIAHLHKLPIYNLGNSKTLNAMKDALERRKEELTRYVI